MSDNTHVYADYTDAITGLPEEAILGQLMWMTISQADVHLENARTALINAGLNTFGMRKVIRPLDSFKKSTRLVAHKFRDGNFRTEFMIRPASPESADPLVRAIILERAEFVKGKKHRLLYDKVGELRLYRGVKKNGEYTGHYVEADRTTAKLGTPLTNEEDTYLTEALDGFPKNFDHWMHHLDSHGVRTFVREYLYHLGATCVKESGGLYFVQQDHAQEINTLGAWINEIGSQYHSVPLLNLSEQRGMIMQAFEDETVQEVGRLMAEVAEILRDPSRMVEARTFDTYGLRAAELKKKVTDYNRMLGSRADRASLEINAYTAQVQALAGRVRLSKAKVKAA